MDSEKVKAKCKIKQISDPEQTYLKLTLIRYTYLIGKDASQIIQNYYSDACLVLGRETFHDIFYGHFAFFCWRWLSHEGRGTWWETKRVHLREVDGCVLTGTRKDNYGQYVSQLFNACDG